MAEERGFNPWGLIAGVGLGIGGAISQRRASRRANRANEERYARLMALRRQEQARTMEDIGRLGTRGRARIAEGGIAERSRISQDLVSRGLTGTTVRPSLLGGSLRREREDVAGLEESLARMRMQTRRGLTESVAGAIERREDVGPSESGYLTALRGFGALAGTGLLGRRAQQVGGGAGLAGIVAAAATPTGSIAGPAPRVGIGHRPWYLEEDLGGYGSITSRHRATGY